MTAVLTIYPLTATETQLDFLGNSDPPLGVVGDAMNAIVGRRIAEASVHRFVTDVARYLREHLRGRWARSNRDRRLRLFSRRADSRREPRRPEPEALLPRPSRRCSSSL